MIYPNGDILFNFKSLYINRDNNPNLYNEDMGKAAPLLAKKPLMLSMSSKK